MPAKSKASQKRVTRSPAETKAAILRAAMQEFAEAGLEGARTDAIARKAGVNKALIHYYFQDKQTLYAAGIDLIFAGLAERMHKVLDRGLPPREAVLAFAGAHFDYLASSPMFPRLVQHEMMRSGPGASPHIRRIVKRYLKPVQQRLLQVMTRGVEAGELRRINPFHFIFSMVAMNVFYFAGAPVVAIISGKNPLEPERVAERRAAVLDVVAAAISPAASPTNPEQRKTTA
jgi:TetR/AcrR family transcriptional regulator